MASHPQLLRLLQRKAWMGGQAVQPRDRTPSCRPTSSIDLTCQHQRRCPQMLRASAAARGAQLVCTALSVLTLCTLVRPKGVVWLVDASPTRAMVGWPGSWQAVWSGNRLDRSRATKATMGGRATRRAVTRVKSEQASKGKLRTPTRPEIGEGSTVLGSSRQMHLGRSAGVMDTARRDSQPGNWGRPACGEGSGLDNAARCWPVRESDRVIVPSKPGNAGGGKAADFWCVCEAAEVR